MITKEVQKRNRKRLSKKQQEAMRAKKRKVRLSAYLIISVVLIITLYVKFPDRLIHISQEKSVEEQIESAVAEHTFTKEEMKELIREVLQEEQAITEEQVHAIIDTKISSRSVSNRTSNTQKTTNLGKFKMTSYYDGDAYLSTNKTGSGKKTSEFEVNDKGWYTYKGKLVFAAATNELKSTGYAKRGSQNKQDKHYFSYYDEVIVTIDGVEYEGIILDSCGAAMWEGETRIDLFVANSQSVINRTVEVKLVNK